MKEAAELLKEFGAGLCGYTPGAYASLTANLPGEPGTLGGDGCGFWGESLHFSAICWKWLQPLLRELQLRRAGLACEAHQVRMAVLRKAEEAAERKEQEEERQRFEEDLVLRGPRVAFQELSKVLKAKKEMSATACQDREDGGPHVFSVDYEGGDNRVSCEHCGLTQHQAREQARDILKERKKKRSKQ